MFFAQPLEKKMLVDMHNGSSFKGYLRGSRHGWRSAALADRRLKAMGGEQVDPDSRGDLHEAFDIGSDSQAFSSGKKSSGNQYPPAEDLPEFKPVRLTFHFQDARLNAEACIGHRKRMVCLACI